MKKKAFFSWSGGKDSALALYYALQNSEYHVAKLVTNVTAGQRKIAVHGVRETMLQAQALQTGLPLQQMVMPSNPTMPVYDVAMTQTLAGLRAEGFATGIYGDLFLQDLRNFRQQALAKEGLTAAFPLWQKEPLLLMEQFIILGFKAIVVCVNGSMLPQNFLGRIIDQQFLDDLPQGVDVCGENGEYHSYVFDGPLFIKPIAFTLGNITCRWLTAPLPPQQPIGSNETVAAAKIPFWYQDILPA